MLTKESCSIDSGRKNLTKQQIEANVLAWKQAQDERDSNRIECIVCNRTITYLEPNIGVHYQHCNKCWDIMFNGVVAKTLKIQREMQRGY